MGTVCTMSMYISTEQHLYLCWSIFGSYYLPYLRNRILTRKRITKIWIQKWTSTLQLTLPLRMIFWDPQRTLTRDTLFPLAVSMYSDLLKWMSGNSILSENKIIFGWTLLIFWLMNHPISMGGSHSGSFGTFRLSRFCVSIGSDFTFNSNSDPDTNPTTEILYNM